MRAQLQAAITVILLCGVCAGGATAQDAAVSAGEVLKHLTGTWNAPEDRTPRSTPLDEQVFGRGAVDVRTVTLSISPSGDADLQVRRSVVGATGKVFAPSLTEVKMHIGDPVASRPNRIEPAVSVTSAEERYLDGDHERWPRDGSRVSISVPDLTGKEINLQLETPDGRGAFGATLVRSALARSTARTGR